MFGKYRCDKGVYVAAVAREYNPAEAWEKQDIRQIMEFLRKGLATKRLPYERRAMYIYARLNFALYEDWVIYAAINQLEDWDDVQP